MHKNYDDKCFLVELVDLRFKIALVDAVQVLGNVCDEQKDNIGLSTHDGCIRV